MILFFSDVHFGNTAYRYLDSSNLNLAELDCKIALSAILNAAKDPSIKLIVFGGDFFDTPRPSAENIKWTIDWFFQMDSLGKPFYLIPGNHDVSSVSNALVFVDALRLKNVFLVKDEPRIERIDDVNLFFIPFISPSNLKDKYKNSMDLVSDICKTINQLEKNVLVSHIHDAYSKICNIYSASVRDIATIDLNGIFSSIGNFKSTIVLLGHIHTAQSYVTQSGVTVVYSGSTTNMDISECSQNIRKSYVIIQPSLTFEYVPINGIRKFRRFTVERDVKDIIGWLKSIRFVENTVVFLDMFSDMIFDEADIREYLRSRKCYLGKILYLDSDDFNSENVDIRSAILSRKNPFDILKEYVDNALESNSDDSEYLKQDILRYGEEVLNDSAKSA